MKSFSLANPMITGSLDTMVEAKTETEAAKTLYMRISKHFKNNLPTFYYSIVDDDENLYHFEVNERKSGKEVNFTIKQASMKKDTEKKVLNVYKKKITEQAGGKDKFMFDEDDKDDDSSSSSSAYYYSPRRVPLYVDPIREFLYNPSYIINIPNKVVVDYPYTYVPSLVLNNGYFVWWGI
jgi:hypothetical protein